MGSSTSFGSTIGISASAPATPDAAGYTALVFTTVGGIESIPAFGALSATNTFQPLNGPQEKHKGPVNYGSLALPMAYDGADAGQVLVRTAADPSNNAQYSFVVTFPNGDKSYFQGRVFGSQLTTGSATNVLMQNSTVEINTKPVLVPHT